MALNCRHLAQHGSAETHRHSSRPCSRPRVECRAASRESAKPQCHPRSLPSAHPWTDQTLSGCASAAAAALVLLASPLACQPAHAGVPYAQELEAAMLREAREARVNTPPSQMQQEESRFDENLMTMELKGFVDMLEKKGKDVKVQELQTERLKVCSVQHGGHCSGVLLSQGRFCCAALCLRHARHRRTSVHEYSCAGPESNAGLVNLCSAAELPARSRWPCGFAGQRRAVVPSKGRYAGKVLPMGRAIPSAPTASA